MTESDAGARMLRELAGRPLPAWAIVSGSGLAGLAGAFDCDRQLAYDEIPGFAPPTVEGHPGRLSLATAGAGRGWLCLGRPHFYEHADLTPITGFVRTLADAGVDTLLLTNAAGGLNPELRPGDVMVITDHIFLPGLTGRHPLTGANDPRGPRFPSLRDAYDPALSEALGAALERAGLSVRRGVYAMVSGPSYETPAEVALLAAAGADAVGMSTAPEVVVARHAGLRVAALSVITNLPAAPSHGLETHDQIVDVSKAVAPRLGVALREFVAGLPSL